MLLIRLAFPTCPRVRWSRRTRGFRLATTVANCVLLTVDMPARIKLRLWRPSVANAQMRTLPLERVCRYVSRLLLGHSFGAFPAPGGTRSSASHARPFGVSVPPKTSLRTTAKYAFQTSFGPLPESRPSALGSRAHSLSSAQCDPSNNGQIQQTETLSCTRTK
jgi:hypothetical protein